MFDIGFSELVLLMLVGLVVLGPKRLPVAIRTVMGWVKTIRGLAANVQNELKQELKLQELQDSIKKVEQLNLKQLSPDLSKTVEELKEQAQKIKDTIKEVTPSLGYGLKYIDLSDLDNVTNEIYRLKEYIEIHERGESVATLGSIYYNFNKIINLVYNG